MILQRFAYFDGPNLRHYTLQAPEYYARTFDGSRGLFRACWTWYRRQLRGAIDSPRSDADVSQWLDARAAELVNDSHSRFYLHG